MRLHLLDTKLTQESIVIIDDTLSKLSRNYLRNYSRKKCFKGRKSQRHVAKRERKTSERFIIRKIYSEYAERSPPKISTHVEDCETQHKDRLVRINRGSRVDEDDSSRLLSIRTAGIHSGRDPISSLLLSPGSR